MCTCRNCSFNATSGPTKQFDSLLAEEVPHASSSTWRRLFRGMKSSKLPRQVDSIRAESSSNGSWRCHRALPESLRNRAPLRSTRQLHPRCEHFAFTCFSYLILSSFVSPLLPLGLGLLLVRGYVRRLMYCRIGLLRSFWYSWYCCFSLYVVTSTCFHRVRLLAQPEVCKRP